MDPEVLAALQARGSVPVVADWTARRKLLRELTVANRKPSPADEHVHTLDREIPGPAGAPAIPVRIYTPRAGAAPFPALVYYHGGGFTIGDLETGDVGCVEAAAGAGCVVVSVDYRLAPEHPFPAGFDDCYEALLWTVANAAALGIDTGRIAVGGASAGGALAAAVALAARDRGGPALSFQLLIYPVIDDRLETPSSQFEDVAIFNRSAAVAMWKNYLGAAHGAIPSPYAAPARAGELAGLPPAYVLTAELDPLRDEGIEYALRLLRAGVRVELHQFADVPHGFESVARSTTIGQRASRDVIAALAAALKRPA